MSYRRRQHSLWRALSNATRKDPVTGFPITNPKGWGLVEVGDQVTTFGRHGAGQPPINGEAIFIACGEVVIKTTQNGKVVERRRSISHVRKVGR